MPTNITVRFFPSQRAISAPSGDYIINYAQKSGEIIDVPCGRNGKCGKCVVWLKGKKTLACQTRVFDHTDIWTQNPDEVELRSHGTIRVERSAIIQSEREIYSDNLSQVPLGIAVDIGTTTVAASLIRLSDCNKSKSETTPELTNDQLFDRVPASILGSVGSLNPQTSIGADVISRIQYETDNPGFGLQQLNHLIIEEINQLIKQLFAKFNIETPNVRRVSVAGNTTMESLFAGVSVQSLGASPFAPLLPSSPPCLNGEKYGLICPQAQVELLPCIGGFLGGDTTAGIYMVQRRIEETRKSNGWGLSRNPKDKTVPWLLVDIGTNGEIVLCDHARNYWGTSAAAGPAFEGAGISCGMRALPGAIESVSLTSEGTLNWTTIDNMPPRGICGSGLLDLSVCLLKTGAINRKGKLLSRPGKPLDITAADVRQIQLAVGAIKTAIVVLLRKAGLKIADLAKIYIAGGFGKHIKIDSILDLGLIPEGKESLTLDQIEYLGNSSLWTAEAITIQPEIHADLNWIAKNVQAVNLAQEPDFAELFARSMRFPKHFE